MTVLFNSFEDDWDSWSELQESFDCIDQAVEVSGTLGLWDGKHELAPMHFECLTEAIDQCIGSDTEDIIFKYDDEYYYLDCYHHDGINHFIIKI